MNQPAAQRPNIIYILADDMGYGDVRFLNADCAFPTPNLDRIGREGMYFSDAHSSSAVCTPSRYSIMTGRYCWRSPLKAGVLGGASQALIDEGRPTVASLLGAVGYKSACIGKWHLGWDWAIKDGHEADPSSWNGKLQTWIDFTKPVGRGPTTVGFDHFYGIAGSLDMPPYVYVEDDMPVEVPTAWGTSNEFIRPGARMQSLRANNVLGHLTDKAVSYIEEQDGTTPYFLYFPITAPHTPISPAPEFDGKSGINPYADFCLEVDARVGQVLDALDRSGQADNTLIIFTCDNGASRGPSECDELEERYGHRCSHIYRGYKSDVWDGGHRLPFMMRWPAAIKPGGRCDQSVGIFDLYATVVDLIGADAGGSGGEDSLSLLPAMQGAAIPGAEERALIHHSFSGMFAIRHGRWKLCRCPGSGGWTYPDADALADGRPACQLYDMSVDPEEQHNLAEAKPEVVEQLTCLLHEAIVGGRSTVGPASSNDGDLAPSDWQQMNWLPELPERFVLDD